MKVFRGFPKAADKLLFHYAVLRSATARSQGVAVPFFEYNEKRFHYETYGSDDAPSLILLMGLGMAGSMWPEAFFVPFLRAGLRVIVFDNRDSGESVHCTESPVTERDVLTAIGRAVLRRPVSAPYALEDMAIDVERLMDHLAVRRAHVVGFSMGGMIAQVLATHSPNRVATLSSLSSAVGNPSTGIGKFMTIYTLLKAPGESPEERRNYYRRVLRALEGKRYPASEEQLEAQVSIASEMPFDPVATNRQLLAILASGDRSHQLRQITVPTLVVHGRDDPLLPFAAGEETARLIEGAKLIGIDGLGHQIPEALFGTIGEAVLSHVFAHPA